MIIRLTNGIGSHFVFDYVGLHYLGHGAPTSAAYIVAGTVVARCDYHGGQPIVAISLYFTFRLFL
jgi:TRAP-type uncharacterized transport system fused permease subunit